MDDELRLLHDAMILKDRMRVLAELQATYWDELLGHGLSESVAEQLLVEWSRSLHGLILRSVPDTHAELELDALLGPGAQPPAPPASVDRLLRGSGDPSRVPPGEAWLQSVDDAVDDSDDLAA